MQKSKERALQSSQRIENRKRKFIKVVKINQVNFQENEEKWKNTV